MSYVVVSTDVEDSVLTYVVIRVDALSFGILVEKSGVVIHYDHDDITVLWVFSCSGREVLVLDVSVDVDRNHGFYLAIMVYQMALLLYGERDG